MSRSDIILPGRYSEYELLSGFIATFAKRERYSALFIEALQLSMKEAFVNAIKHGNGGREDLTVSCRLLATANTLLACIRDCGKGFNPQEQPSPVTPLHLFKLSGRGLYIIQSIAEIVALECDGHGCTLMLRYIPY
ncbi:MAG: ATP-binding protein [Chlorobium sp.]